MGATATERVKLTFEGMCVGCQYPEHRDAVNEILGMTDEQVNDSLILDFDTVEYVDQATGETKFERGVAVQIPGIHGAERLGWIPAAYLQDAKDFMAMREKVRRSSAKRNGTTIFVPEYDEQWEITKVRWENEKEGVLKSFDFKYIVKGLLKK
jgi:hypothetical protein